MTLNGAPTPEGQLGTLTVMNDEFIQPPLQEGWVYISQPFTMTSHLPVLGLDLTGQGVAIAGWFTGYLCGPFQTVTRPRLAGFQVSTEGEWDGRRYGVQQVAPIVSEEEGRFVVITVYVFYFQEGAKR